MSVRAEHDGSLRLDRVEVRRLVWAIAISLLLHLLIWGTYSLGKKYHWWEKLHWPAWVQKLTRALPSPSKQPEALQPVDREPPLVFVEVSPAQAEKEPPKDARYYSDKNAVAANPDPEKDTNTPKITGTQTQVAKTEESPRKKFDQLMPSPPKPDVEPAEEARAKPTLEPGDLTLAKPDTNPRPDTGNAEKSRPRTIKEAMARQQITRIPGQRMKQDGGVNRLRLVPGLDTKATPFGAYDAAFIEAVSQRWYDLLESMSYDGYRTGRVVVQFKLNYDGRITELKILENNVTETLGLLCQKAVQDPSPFDKWPREMRLMVGEDYRKITFTFYYN
jgi:hypothetical protein